MTFGLAEIQKSEWGAPHSAGRCFGLVTDAARPTVRVPAEPREAMAVVRHELGEIALVTLTHPLTTQARSGPVFVLPLGTTPAQWQVADTVSSLVAGEMRVVAPWQAYSLGLPRRGTLRVLIGCLHAPEAVGAGESAGRALRLMAAPLREAGLVDDGVLARLVAQGQAAIATLPAGPAPDAPVDFRIRRVVAELRRTPNRAVAELAQLAGLCLPHFFHRFRACTGLTPRGFANAIRLERALDGVADTAMPLAALSRQLGFTHQSHFTRFFRSRVGFSPRAYRACAGSGRRLSGDARHVA